MFSADGAGREHDEFPMFGGDSRREEALPTSILHPVDVERGLKVSPFSQDVRQTNEKSPC